MVVTDDEGLKMSVSMNGSSIWDAARRTVFVLAAIAFIGSLAFSYHLTSIYVGYPQAPDARTQRIIPYDVKSTTVYVSQRQMNEIKTVRDIEITSGIIFFALIAWLRFHRAKK